MDSGNGPDPTSSYRKILSMAVGAMCKSAGFASIEPDAFGVLDEVLESFLTELARSSKMLAENCGRSQAVPGDITLALVEMGFDIRKIPLQIRDGAQNKLVVAPPKTPNQPPPPKTLRIGRIKPKPSQIPDHLPPFPDPHTYMKSEVTDDYEPGTKQARIDADMTRREVEVSLVNFHLKIEPNIELIPGDPSTSILLPRDDPQPYVEALYPEHIQESLAYFGKKGKEVVVKLDDSIDNPYLKPPVFPKTIERRTLSL